MFQRVIDTLIDQGTSANVADIGQAINFFYFIRT